MCPCVFPLHWALRRGVAALFVAMKVILCFQSIQPSITVQNPLYWQIYHPGLS